MNTIPPAMPVPSAPPNGTVAGYIGAADSSGNWYVVKVGFGPGVGAISWSIVSGPYVDWLSCYAWQMAHQVQHSDTPNPPNPPNTPNPAPAGA